jgi:hypothetical protein
MGMGKHIRECRSICEQEGLNCISISHGGKHLSIQTEFGRLIAPSTPGGQRWRHRLRTSVRRILVT